MTTHDLAGCYSNLQTFLKITIRTLEDSLILMKILVKLIRNPNKTLAIPLQDSYKILV